MTWIVCLAQLGRTRMRERSPTRPRGSCCICSRRRTCWSRKWHPWHPHILNRREMEKKDWSFQKETFIPFLFQLLPHILQVLPHFPLTWSFLHFRLDLFSSQSDSGHSSEQLSPSPPPELPEKPASNQFKQIDCYSGKYSFPSPITLPHSPHVRGHSSLMFSCLHWFRPFFASQNSCELMSSQSRSVNRIIQHMYIF